MNIQLTFINSLLINLFPLYISFSFFYISFLYIFYYLLKRKYFNGTTIVKHLEPYDLRVKLIEIINSQKFNYLLKSVFFISIIFVTTLKEYDNISMLISCIISMPKQQCFLQHNTKITQKKRTMLSSIKNSLKKSSLINGSSLCSSDKKNICMHAGRMYRNMPKLKQADHTNQHMLVFKTKCNQITCNTVNCSDIKNIKNIRCPGRTPSENEKTIPPTAKGFETVVVGNLTSQAPNKKPKIILNTHRNYKKLANKQEMVIEKPNSSPVNSADIKVNKDATKFVQEKQHHDDIQNNT